MIAAAANTENTITWRSGQRKSSKQNQVSQNNCNLVYKFSFMLFSSNTSTGKSFAGWNSSHLLLKAVRKCFDSGFKMRFICFLYFKFRFWETQPLVSVGKPPPDWKRCRFVFSYIWLRHLVQQASYSKTKCMVSNTVGLLTVVGKKVLKTKNGVCGNNKR